MMQRSVHENMRGSTRGVGAIFAIGLLITVAAILFGRFDDGQIDVSAVIVQSNEEHIEAGETSEVAPVPAANPTRGLPNGGLVGTGNAESTPPPAETETETGTSTENGEGDASTEENTETQPDGTNGAGVSGDQATESSATPSEENTDQASAPEATSE